MAFGSKRKLAARTDAEEASVVELDCSNSGDEQNTADGADEEEESAENGTATAAKPLLDEVILFDAQAFAGMERDGVDMHIMMFLCANGIPFNVLRSPQYPEMVAAIQKAPKGYKPPAYEKARTTLLDACKKKVETDLDPVRQTWYSHGVSIVSDGWTNMKTNL
ncbi:hypothetical protein QYE76_021890 [Lolium multiflorum]|uniref:DUF659 domain-containing protein n=1 Tax=Lolium multiflorum TaxID=4521 RepID=A0AAD8R7C5_LOLMU|nr:hypothetical protein QYE76_021890 [Lolium multiflorum]